MKIAVVLVLAIMASGCARLPFSGDSAPFASVGRGSATEVAGIRFRSRLLADRAAPRDFTTATRGASRNVEAALEAGRVRAVEYCIRRFGGSEIAWSIGPDRPAEQVTIGDGGALVLAGRCLTR